MRLFCGMILLAAMSLAYFAESAQARCRGHRFFGHRGQRCGLLHRLCR